MQIEGVDVGEYDEADRNYHEKLTAMYRYVVHIKPHVVKALTEEKDEKKVAEIANLYLNIGMVFGEFRTMTTVQIPNLSFKRKFYLETISKFNSLLTEYKKIVPGDDLVLNEMERKLSFSR